MQVVKFAVNIAVCYLLAYGMAKPFALWVLSGAGEKVQTNIAMFVGMVLFTGLNYLGQTPCRSGPIARKERNRVYCIEDRKSVV